MTDNPFRRFFIELFEALSRTIRAKVIIFEVLIILFAAGTIGVILTVNMQNVLVRKAHVLSERIARDLAGSVQFDSMSGTDAAVKSFKGVSGLVYIGYYGSLVLPDRVKTVHLYAGAPPSEEYLASVVSNLGGITNFTRNAEVLRFETGATNAAGRPVYEPGYEYYMPVTVKDLGWKRIGFVVLRYSKKPIEREIARMRLIIIAITLLVIAVSIFLSVRGANSILKPILMMTDGVKRFGAGDTRVRIEIAAKDELGVLAGAFNRMVVSIREKLEMQKYVSTSTVRMIEQSVTKSDSEERTTHREVATLFFSDIRGFTSMSEKLDPQEVVDILNLYLDVQSNIIHDFAGDIDKFVGDEIGAVFTGEDMAVRAVDAARRIQAKLRETNDEREKSGADPVHIGIGIHTGEVVMGSIGSHDRMDYTVIGDNVNLTARLCSAAGKGEIIVSKEVYSRLGDRKNFEKLEPITVKGKSKPIEVYRASY
jgi:adenylate cyclase